MRLSNNLQLWLLQVACLKRREEDKCEDLGSSSGLSSLSGFPGSAWYPDTSIS